MPQRRLPLRLPFPDEILEAFFPAVSIRRRQSLQMCAPLGSITLHRLPVTGSFPRHWLTNSLCLTATLFFPLPFPLLFVVRFMGLVLSVSKCPFQEKHTCLLPFFCFLLSFHKAGFQGTFFLQRDAELHYYYITLIK